MHYLLQFNQCIKHFKIIQNSEVKRELNQIFIRLIPYWYKQIFGNSMSVCYFQYFSDFRFFFVLCFIHLIYKCLSKRYVQENFPSYMMI